MSAGGAFGGARGVQSKAPEKGIFPLDHFGECAQVSAALPMRTQGSIPWDHLAWWRGLSSSARACRSRNCLSGYGLAWLQVKEAYMTCLKGSNGKAEECTEVARLYLECRMDRYGFSLAEQIACTLMRMMPEYNFPATWSTGASL